MRVRIFPGNVPHPSLYSWSYAQKAAIAKLEEPEDGREACDVADGLEERDYTPHRREGGRAGDDRPARFAGMKSRQQIVRCNRTSGRRTCLDETNSAAPVEPAHCPDFANAKRAGTVEPDGYPVVRLIDVFGLAIRVIGWHGIALFAGPATVSPPQPRGQRVSAKRYNRLHCARRNPHNEKPRQD